MSATCRAAVRALAGALGTAATLTAVAAAPANAATDATWEALAHCESSGVWSLNTGNGYDGGLQFSPSTWSWFGGGAYAPRAHQASRSEQIAVAERVLAVQGWGAWPACSRRLGLTDADAIAVEQPAPAATPEVAAPAAPAPSGATSTYVVAPGNTSYSIARWHGTDVAGLMALNPGLRDASVIYVGQVLVVPAG